MMRMFLLVGFLGHLCTAEIVNSVPHWPDKQGEKFVYHTLELDDDSETIARPSRKDYPEFYKEYPLRFVKDIPMLEGTKSVDMFAIEAPSSPTGVLRWIPGLDPESPQFKAMAAMTKADVWGKQFPMMVHTGVGYLMKDKKGMELGRIAISFWAVSNEMADEAKHGFKNRAVVAFTQCKGDWEGGYFSKASKVKTLTPEEYNGAIVFMKDYTQKYPFYSGTEIVTRSGKVLNPARTCNTFTEQCTKKIANVDAMKANLIRLGYSVVTVPDHQAKRVSKADVPENRGMTTVVLPSFWNEDGILDSSRDKATKFWVITPESRTNPRNYEGVMGKDITDMYTGGSKALNLVSQSFQNSFVQDKPKKVSLLSKTGTSESETMSDPGVLALASKLKKIMPKHNHATPLTLQATCHSYSGARNVVGKGSSFSLLEHREFTVEKDAKILRVQPGVRFTDVLETVKNAGLSLPTHGNYGGQTIIGAVSTGTHGSGFPAVHNYVKRLKVINGKGEEKSLTPDDEEFKAWLMSAGSLGAVLELSLELVPAFNVKKTSALKPHNEAVEEFAQNKHAEVGFPLVKGKIDFMPAMVFTTTVTQEPATKHTCCYNYFAATGSPDEVLNFNDDFKYDPKQEPTLPRTTHCQHSTLQVYELATKGINVPAMSVDINIKPADLQKTLDLVKAVKWGKDTDMLMRWILKDDKDVLLSPYFDGDRISLDINQHLKWRSESDRVEFTETHNFQESMKELYSNIQKAGIDVRFHVGKNGFQQLQFWDKDRFNKFHQIKMKNDPEGVFSNHWYESQKMKAGHATLVAQENFVLASAVHGSCYESAHPGAKEYLWDCVRNGFSGNKMQKDQSWDLHSTKNGGRTCKDMGFFNNLGIGPPYKRMPVEVFANAGGSVMLAALFGGTSGSAALNKQLEVLGKFQLNKKCTDGTRLQYP